MQISETKDLEMCQRQLTPRRDKTDEDKTRTTQSVEKIGNRLTKMPLEQLNPDIKSV